MRTSPITPADLAASVIAVPPLALTPDRKINLAANKALTRHIEAGGITSIVWGGNAQLQHWQPSRYAELLAMIEESVAPGTWALPSVGPDYGKLIDEAAVLKGTRFPCAMALPMQAHTTPDGIATAYKEFVQRSGKPLIAYVRAENYLHPDTLAAMVAAGEVVAIKYAVIRPDMTKDAYLASLCAAVGAERIASGSGELVATPHLMSFGLAGFTAGCVCIAPRLSMLVLKALKARDQAEVERLLAAIRPLETLRERVNLIRVLHDAVTVSGIANMGPILPMLSPCSPETMREIEAGVATLMAAEQALVTPTAAAAE